MDAKAEQATGATLPAPFSNWFATKGWSPREHQLALLETTAGGHTWDYFDRMAQPMLAFVADALQKESRRLM